MEDITAVVINYNGGSLVLDSVESILNQQGVSIRLIVVDDGSTDGSPKDIEEKFPEVDIYREEKNTGHLNRLRNKGLSFAETDRVFLTDNDIVYDNSCISELIRIMEDSDDAAACIPRLTYFNDRSRIYHEGGKIHYVGTSTAPNRDTHVDDVEPSLKTAVGGGIALFDMEKLQYVGKFDTNYEFAWGCDGELHQRLLLAGYKCLCVPSAVGYHEFEPFTEARHYRARGHVYNRWRFILTTYSGPTLLLIAPALVVYEFVQASYYLLKGIPLLYVKGTFDAVRYLPEILKRREKIQALRAVPDKELLTAGPIYIRPSGGISGKLISAIVTVLSLFFSGYWSLVRPLLPDKEASPEG